MVVMQSDRSMPTGYRAKLTNILMLGISWFPTSPGGLDRYVYELCQHLASQHTSLELCGLDLPLEQEVAGLQLTNLATENVSLWRRLRSSRRLFKQRLAPVPPDAINLHFALYSLPILSLLPTKVPITFTFHGPWAAECAAEGDSGLSFEFKRQLEKYVYRRCDRFITLSQAFADILHDEYQVSYERIHVVPGGINTHIFQPTMSRVRARIQQNFPLDRPVLFAPRRLVQRVGLSQLLDALVWVKSKVPNIWLAIAGKGPQRAMLEEQVRRLDLQDNVKFLGYVSDADLMSCYQAADLTVVPSQSLEGFGLVLLESLACGTPVMVTPVGGMPEVVRPFAPQLITENITSQAIAERLVMLLTDRSQLPDREVCHRYAVENYDWRLISERVREILMLPKTPPA